MDGRSVVLRAVEPSDLELLLRFEHDPEAIRRARFVPRHREAFMAHWTTHVLGDPTTLARAVVVDGDVAGSVVAWWQDGTRFVGYWLGRAYWGRGVGTAALQMFLAEETYRPLYADPHVSNTGSVRLLERCGFRRTGTVQREDGEFLLLVLD